MKRIKMVGLDLDGTLLTDEKKLTARTRTALERAIAQGVVVLVATGRPLSGIPEVMRDFPGIRYSLTANGARIMDMQLGKPISETLIPQENAKMVLDVFAEFETIREIYYGGIGYANKSDLQRLPEFMPEPAMVTYISKTRVPVEDILVKFQEMNQPLDKVQALFREVSVKQEALKRLESVPDVQVTGALVNNIEVNAKGVNKGDGLLRLGKMLGIERDEIMACGDGWNDYDMIRKVGLGVVMQNGDERVKAVADYITGTNEEEGVAKAIEKFVLA